ncbi:MAG: hypothetical protein ACRDRA_06805 [Pseudonocardiaceae bacterium]
MRRQRREATRATGGFVRQVRLDPTAGTGRYPFTLPVVQHLARARGVDLEAPVTFLVGDNGTGKSTLCHQVPVRSIGLRSSGVEEHCRPWTSVISSARSRACCRYRARGAY